MILRNPATRLTIALVLLTVNLLFLANMIGLIPDQNKLALEHRKVLSESLALQFCAAADKGEYQIIQNTLRATVERSRDVLSAAIRTNDGQLIALAGDHLAKWKPSPDGKSTPTHLNVPIYRSGQKWATIELRFVPIWMDGLLKGFTNSFVALLAFVALGAFICYFFLIRRTLRALDPTAVIPARVQKAFDLLQEGIALLDEKEQIVMANKALAGFVGRTPPEMIGVKASEMGWLDLQGPNTVHGFPWIKVLKEGSEQQEASLTLLSGTGARLKLTVSAGMVTDNTGRCRGALVTFDDMTQMEEKNFELTDLVEKLRMSHEEINSKSKELEFLATRDPLTLCLNRRSLDRKFEELFTQAKAAGSSLSCLMVDIDLFKSVNDRFGHAVGDQVIRGVADVLKTSTRDSDLVGRYGGEEFCVVLPGLDLEISARIAERIRSAIEKSPCGGVNITASLGVSSLDQNANNREELVNFADKALYVAKKGGRNRVVKWGDKGLETHAQAGKDEKKATKPSEKEDSRASSDSGQLRQRVQELEALLEKRQLELDHQRMYDFQTGLATRTLFEDRIAQEIARSRRTNGMLTVLSARIDTIKQVEETLGHDAAIQLVKACGDLMNSVLRRDIDTVAVVETVERAAAISRISQTEFGILLTDFKQVDHVTWVIKRLLDAFEKPLLIKGREIYPSIFVGASIFPLDGQSVEALCTSAANACTYAKRLKGENRYLFASQNINETAIKHLQIETCLHEAIENNELQLHYQPKVQAGTGHLVGVEALLRWQSARLGAVPPSTFIPVAERTGQIGRIGDWVLYEACKQMRAWLDAGFSFGSVAVNVSGIQLRQRNLANRLLETLNAFHLDTDSLEIELTESALVNSHDKSFTVLKEIQKAGIRVSMDDFGTGYSSLAYLRDMPINCIKIDRSFINRIGKDEGTEKLIASIVSLAHGLGLEVVAEGVEERRQVEFLKGLGCESLQGYLFGRPAPAEQVTGLLETRRAA
jgi:diguanylate cyclase (GGDEF)-like protein